MPRKENAALGQAVTGGPNPGKGERKVNRASVIPKETKTPAPGAGASGRWRKRLPPERNASWEEQLRLLAPERESRPQQDEPSVNEFLESCQREAREINQRFLERQCRLLMIMLVQVRGLPGFYFREEARKAGIRKEGYRKWNIREWPPEKLGNEQETREMTQVLLRVQLRLWHYQEPATYAEALRKAGQELDKALESGLSKNKLSQRIRVRNQALAAIRLADPDRPLEGVCPWEILNRLQEEPEKGPRLVDLAPPKEENRPEEKGPPLPKTPNPRNEVAFGSSCHHCQAGWPTLRFDSATWIAESSWHVYLCYNCSRENLVKPPEQERYGPCANCRAPYHQLRGTVKDAGGNTVKNCLSCKRSVLVPARSAV